MISLIQAVPSTDGHNVTYGSSNSLNFRFPLPVYGIYLSLHETKMGRQVSLVTSAQEASQPGESEEYSVPSAFHFKNA